MMKNFKIKTFIHFTVHKKIRYLRSPPINSMKITLYSLRNKKSFNKISQENKNKK